MRPVDLWRHSSFRLAIGVSVFILTILILASGVGYGLMQSQLKARQDARVTEIFAAIEQTSLQGDQIDMIEAITARIKASPDRSTAYLLKDEAGMVLAGNVKDVAFASGWMTVAAADLDVATDYPYRIFTGPVGAYRLTVGITNADLDDLREITLGAFGWASLIALLGTVLVSIALAARVQNRLSQAEDAAARVAQGDLSARLPVSSRGDDLDRISRAINLSLTRLETLVDAMRQVSTDIAHDLRTPLNRLRIRIETASDKLAKGLPVAEDLAEATAESDRINETFSALLRIAQIEAGTRRENFTSLDLFALMRNVAEVYEVVADDAGHVLRLEVGGASWIMGDQELLTQCFANLIENAIRHCPSATTITCTVRTTPHEVIATISDTGSGIPENERDKVLRRLYRLEKSRTTDGTGLGLALVKAVADLHGAGLALGDAAPGLRVDLTFQRILGTK